MKFFALSKNERLLGFFLKSNKIWATVVLGQLYQQIFSSWLREAFHLQQNLLAMSSKQHLLQIMPSLSILRSHKQEL